MPTPKKRIQFNNLHHQPVARFLGTLAGGPAKRLLAVDEINTVYADLLNSDAVDAPFSKILRLLDITYLVDSGELATIPDQGPLVVVANHPFGGIDIERFNPIKRNGFFKGGLPRTSSRVKPASW